MEPAQQLLITYGWDHLLCDIVAAALSTYGWRVAGSRTQISESGNVGLVLVYGSRPTSLIIEDVRCAHAECPNANIVLVGKEITDDDLLLFVRAGVGAYVDTSQGLADLLDAMHMLRENRSPSRSRLTRLVLDNISRLAQQRDTHTDIRLTPREKEILDFVTRGLSNKEIADRLSIALNTVKNHVHNMLDKLNVRSRHEAAWVETHSSRQSARSRRSKNPLIDHLNEQSLPA